MRSFQEHRVCMPLEFLARRSKRLVTGQSNLRTAKVVVRSPIIPVSFEPRTNAELVVRRDSDVPAIEQCVHVRTEEQPILDTVLTSNAHWSDMRRVENDQSLFP